MPGSVHTVAFGAPATALLTDLVRQAKAAGPFAPVTVVVPSATAGTALRRRLAVDLGGLVGVSFRSLPQVAEALVEASAPTAPVVPAMVARAHLRAELRRATALTTDPLVAASAATERALVPTLAELDGVPDAVLDVLAALGPRPAAVVDLHRRHRTAIGGPGVDAIRAAAAGVADGTLDPAVLGAVVVHLPRRVRPGELGLLGALAARGPLAVVLGTTGDPEADAVAAELHTAVATAIGVPPEPLPAVAPVAPVAPAAPVGAPRAPTKVVWAPDPAEEVALAVREVVAALLGDGADGRPPLRAERIAVVHRVRDPYAAMLHAALAAARVPHHVASVTTLAQSVPGRVLVALLDVAAGGFRRRDVAAFWRAGPIVDPAGGGSDVPVARWDALARRAGVGGGLDQWRLRLDQAVEARRAYLRSLPAEPLDPSLDPSLDPAVDPIADPAAVDVAIGHLEALRAHIEWLAEELTPPADPSWPSWSDWLRRVLTAVLGPEVRRRQPEALDAVLRAVDGLAGLAGIDLPPDLERVRRALEPELGRPDHRHGRFGHGVLVSRLVDVVGADLDLVVVVGAADGRFPPRRREDPLLPDRLRAATGGWLAPRSLRREEERRDYLAALAAAPRRVLIGHRSDPREQRSRQPAAWFVSACSDLAGQALASDDLPGLRSHPWYLEVPSFEAGPAGLTPPASPFELDLGDLLADHRRGAVGDGVVARGAADLARGLAAGIARRQGRFDEWSGHVGPHPELAVSLERPLSATSLEGYAVCPFRYLLRSVLRVGAIDDPAEAPLISAIDEGSLVHEVLERFIAEHRGKPAAEPWSAEERDRLRAIVEEVGGRYQAEGRTGRTLLWQVRLEQLQRQLLGVLDRDEELRAEAGVSPVDVELFFGAGAGPDVTLTLSGGRTLSFKGSIDRVDRSPDGRTLVVYDYKTGSPRTFDRVKEGIATGDLTAAGTKLQLPIYALGAAAAHPGAEEIAAHYWFVGRKGEGKTLGAVVDEPVRARFRAVMDVIVDGIEGGRFPANPGKEEWDFGTWTHANCSWCDFDRVCPTTRGETWVQLRNRPELRRYVDLADGAEAADGAADSAGAGEDGG